MGIKISELPVTTAPTNDDIIPVLDKADNILKGATIRNIVGSAGVVGTEITQHDYDLLPTSEKESGMYFITDGYGGLAGTVISYADFINLTPAEQNSGSYIVTGMNPQYNAYGLAYKDGKNVGQGLDQVTASLTELAGKISVLGDRTIVAYNPDNDHVEGYYNGAWRFIMSAGFQSTDIYKDGDLKIAFDNPPTAIPFSEASTYYNQPWNNTNNQLESQFANDSVYADCMVSTNTVDLTNYSGIKVIAEGIEGICDVSSLTGAYYIGIACKVNDNKVSIFAKSAKSNYLYSDAQAKAQITVPHTILMANKTYVTYIGLLQ